MPPPAALPAFRLALDDFVANLDQVIASPDFTFFKLYVHLSAPSQVQELFHKCVAVPYGDAIRRRDEGFFLGKREQLVDERYNKMSLVETLAGVWSSLHPDDKQTVWDHLNTLLALDEGSRGAEPPDPTGDGS
jgi:hypothetical protein